MNRLRIETGGRELLLDVPSCNDELSREQLLACCRMRLGGEGAGPAGLHAALSGIPPALWERMPPAKRYFVERLMDFALEGEFACTCQLLPYIEAGGERFIGYQAGFSNTTWEEFIYADGYAMAGRYAEAAAVLYRRQREGWDGETDRRVPFTIYGTEGRARVFSSMAREQLLASALVYRALRRSRLEERFPNVFSGRKAKAGEKDAGPASWVGIHRGLMGDRFYDEAKYYALPVCVVLSRLDRVMAKGH